MCTVEFGHIPETIERNAVQVILSDHHYWGGLRATQHLAHLGRIFDIGISMHSNSHSAWPTQPRFMHVSSSYAESGFCPQWASA